MVCKVLLPSANMAAPWTCRPQQPAPGRRLCCVEKGLLTCGRQLRGQKDKVPIAADSSFCEQFCAYYTLALSSHVCPGVSPIRLLSARPQISRPPLVAHGSPLNRTASSLRPARTLTSQNTYIATCAYTRPPSHSRHTPPIVPQKSLGSEPLLPLPSADELGVSSARSSSKMPSTKMHSGSLRACNTSCACRGQAQLRPIRRGQGVPSPGLALPRPCL